FSNGLHTLASYTWSKSIDVSSGYFNVENGPGGGSTLQNFFDQNSGRGVSAYDVPTSFPGPRCMSFRRAGESVGCRADPPHGSWAIGRQITFFRRGPVRPTTCRSQEILRTSRVVLRGTTLGITFVPT